MTAPINNGPFLYKCFPCFGNRSNERMPLLVSNHQSQGCLSSLKQKFKSLCCCSGPAEEIINHQAAQPAREESEQVLIEEVDELIAKISTDNVRENKKLLAKVNILRDRIILQKTKYSEGADQRELLKQKIISLEKAAIDHLLTPQFVKLQNEHLHLSRALVLSRQQADFNLNRFIKQNLKSLSSEQKLAFQSEFDRISDLDGRIDNSLNVNQTFDIELNGKRASVKCQQLPALYQLNGKNNLCPYYGLYYLLDAYFSKEEGRDQKQPYLDRAFFNECFQEWSTLIYQKRVLSGVTVTNNHIMQIEQEIAFLNSSDLQHLVKNSSQFSKLQKVENLFYVEASEEEYVIDGETINFSERFNLNDESIQYNPNKAAFCLLKITTHYYFFTISSNQEAKDADRASYDTSFIHSAPRNLFSNLDGNFLENHLQSTLETLIK